MTFGELIQLNPQHVAELSSFFEGFEFDDVEIAAQEKVLANCTVQPRTTFDDALDNMRIDGIYRGKRGTHVLLQAKNRDYMEDNIFYCVSCAKNGAYEEHILFKLICHV